MSINIAPLTKLLMLVALAAILVISKKIVLITLIGIGIGVLLSPLLDILQKKIKIPRGIAAFLVLIVIFILTVLVVSGFGWVIVDQTNAFIEGLPEYSDRARQMLEKLFNRFPWALEQVKAFDFAETLQKSANYLFKGAHASAMAVGGILFALVLGVYLAVGGQKYFLGTVRVLPMAHRNQAKDILIKCACVIRMWFRAQLIDMAIIGAITTVGLWIIGIKFWALFGLLTAILGIIPYVGIMIVVALVGLITLASDPDNFYWVLLVFFITQQIEGNLILPLVMKGQVEIPEALLVVAMLFFGTWFGLLGIFIAPPIVAVAICLYRNLYLPRIEEGSTS